MSAEQALIGRLLRKVECLLRDGHDDLAGEKVGEIGLRVSRASDFNNALEILYTVEGFDRFALRLMWLIERLGKGPEAVADSVLDYEAELLSEMVRTIVSVRKEPEQPAKQESDSFGDFLHQFGQTIEEIRRRSYDGGKFSGLSADSLDRILAEAASLSAVVLPASKPEVLRFLEGLSFFVNYVLENQIFEEERVMSVITNANLTLQTFLEAEGAKDAESLQQTIELLEDPENFLGYTQTE